MFVPEFPRTSIQNTKLTHELKAKLKAPLDAWPSVAHISQQTLCEPFPAGELILFQSPDSQLTSHCPFQTPVKAAVGFVIQRLRAPGVAAPKVPSYTAP